MRHRGCKTSFIFVCFALCLNPFQATILRNFWYTYILVEMHLRNIYILLFQTDGTCQCGSQYTGKKCNKFLPSPRPWARLPTKEYRTYLKEGFPADMELTTLLPARTQPAPGVDVVDAFLKLAKHCVKSKFIISNVTRDIAYN